MFDMENRERVAGLRKLAEVRVGLTTIDTLSGELDTKRLLHELQVHQIELEMQNEELSRIVAEKNEHEEHLRNIITNTPAGYFHIDAEGRFLDVNNAWLRMHGYDSKDEVIGKNFSIMQVDSGSDSALEHLAELKKGNPIPFGEFRSRRKDGTVGYHIFSAQPVVHIGEIVGFEWFIIDISERKQIEDVQSYLLEINSLHPGEDFFELLARYLAMSLDMDFVCIDRLEGAGLSARTVAVWCDDHFEDNVTYDLKDTPCGDVVGNNVCCFPASVCQLFPRDQVLQDLRAESYVGVTLWSHTHEPIGLIAVISRRPLVNRLLAENIMNLVGVRAAGEMERMDALEVQKNLEKQILDAQKLESLGVLAGGIAHDFNNIMAVIIGNCALVKLRPEFAEDNIEQIEKAAERAAELCRQMLTYAGKSLTVKSSLNIEPLVAETVKMLKSTLPQNAMIKFASSANIPSISGDASQIRQIVMNLLINAAESVGEEQGEVCVSLAEKTVKADPADKDLFGKVIAAGRYLCLEVTDNGCGMDEEIKRRIFEPFYTTKFTGRGLGMSAVLGIITAHKGALQLSSQQGQGTTFKAYFPVLTGDSPVDKSPQPLASAPWQGSGTILLAEDEAQLRTIAKVMLEELGFTVIDAGNGTEAIERYQENASDITLVLTDIGMPLMDGYELCRELKKLNPELPIIISSGFGDAEVISHIARENLAGMVSKPYNFVQLQEVMKSVVETIRQ